MGGLEISLAAAPPILLAIVVWWASRFRTSIFLGVATALFAALLAVAVSVGTVAMFNVGPKMASGYHSWVFPSAVALLTVVLWFWRRKKQPGFSALGVSVLLSFVVHLFGFWSA